MGSPASTGTFGITPTRWVPVVALGLVVLTFVRLGLDADAVAWAAAQVVLVVLAHLDLTTRRLPNTITIPVSLLAVALRAGFERSALAEVVLAGLIAFGSFLLISIVLRGGLGMGDVKLAGMLGFLLGSAVASALLIGVVAGGVAAMVLVAAAKASRRSTIAYGQYLALGGVIAILFFHPPSLV